MLSSTFIVSAMFECDEKRSATQLLLSFLFSPCRFECDEKRSACSISLCVVEFSGLNAMKSGVQLNIWEGLATSLPGLNAMKSGVQRILRKPVLPPVCEFECDEERSATLWRFQLWRCQEMFESNEERGCVEEEI